MYDVPPDAVKVVDPPWQKDALAGEIVPDGVGVTVTVAVFEAGTAQLPSIIVTL